MFLGSELVISKFVTPLKLSQAMVDMETIIAESPTARLLQALHSRNLEETKEAILAGANIVDSNFNALEYALQKAVFANSGTRLEKERIRKRKAQIVPFRTLTLQTSQIKRIFICNRDGQH